MPRSWKRHRTPHSIRNRRWGYKKAYSQNISLEDKGTLILDATNTASGPYTQHTLDNGLRIVIERMPDVRSAAAGFLVRTGARDEVASQAGVSHFLEHMMFKGTNKRNWREITLDFDRMGSSYNAFTSEDRTVFYGWVPKAKIAGQIELLADMMRSTIPADEFDTEKNVILEEIAMAKDSLEHVAFDFLQEKVFAGHPLAWPILGYEQTVETMTCDGMREYFQRRYAPQNLFLIVTGNVDPLEIIGLAEEYCGQWKPSGSIEERVVPTIRKGTDKLCVDRFGQEFVALTFASVGGSHELAETASATAAILGGENSRFFWNIVQKGISARAGVHHLEYTDCGAMMLYGMCQPEKSDALLEAARTQADIICKEPVAAHEVDRVKNRRRTGLAVECEVPYHRLTQIMDDLESVGAPRTVKQMLADVDAITVESIREYLLAYPINVEGHLTIVGPQAEDSNRS